MFSRLLMYKVYVRRTKKRNSEGFGRNFFYFKMASIPKTILDTIEICFDFSFQREETFWYRFKFYLSLSLTKKMIF